MPTAHPKALPPKEHAAPDSARDNTMTDASDRSRTELRTLLTTRGPAGVLEEVASLCEEHASHETDSDHELWECAAAAAGDAAAALSDEPAPKPTVTPDTPAAAAPATTTAASHEAPRAAPATAMSARQKKIMTKDPWLGPRPASATFWRCFRSDSPKKVGTPLSYSEEGYGTNEWPIKSCVRETIAARWGAGNYVVQYIHLDAAGKRRPCGRSKMLTVTGKRRGAARDPYDAHNEHDEHEPQAATLVRSVPAPTPVMPPMLGADGGVSSLFALMTYMHEQTERTRKAAAEDAKIGLERLAIERRSADDRYRIDQEKKLEKKKLKMEERAAEAKSERLRARLERETGEPEDEEARIRAIAQETWQELAPPNEEDDDGKEGRGTRAAPAPTPSPNQEAIITGINALKELVTNGLTYLATRDAAANEARRVPRRGYGPN